MNSGFLQQKLVENVVLQPRCLQKYQMQHFVGEGEGGHGFPGGSTGEGFRGAVARESLAGQ